MVSDQRKFRPEFLATAVLIVIGIVMLAVIQLPAVRDSQFAALTGGSGSPITPMSSGSVEEDTVRHLSMAMVIYASDYDDNLPPDFADTVALQDALQPYHSSSWSVGSASVELNPRLAGENLTMFQNPLEVPLLWIDGSSTGSDFIVGMADGTIRSMTKAELDDYKLMPYDGSSR
ncbi:MAG: hypothetical protein KDC26_12285 [Armatimonadetes bacterium]|nr:hypothetical protein [Armatimonadota bacterium]